MKPRKLATLLAGVLLLAVLSVWFLQKSGNTAAIITSDILSDDEGPAPSSPSVVVADQPIADSTDTGVGATLIERSEQMLADGVSVRVLELEDAGRGKYPLQRVERILRRDSGTGRYEPYIENRMVANHLLVKLVEGTSEQALDALNKSFGASTVRQLSIPDVYIVQFDSCTLDSVPDAVEFYSAFELVDYAEPDYFRKQGGVPDDSEYANQWGLEKIGAPTAWDQTTGTSSVVIAVIDTGADLDHEDLVDNLWQNPGEVEGDGLDNDGNGQIDDVYGWDFVNTDALPEDDNEHGTHCAGIIGAVGNNAQQVAGVCWNISIMPVKVLGEDGYGVDSDIAEGVRYAVDAGATILNNSYGGYVYNQTMFNTVEYANSLGVFFVAAAGNGGPDDVGDDNDALPLYPAGYDVPNVISVAATDQSDQLTDFSNYGEDSVDIAAPGYEILSTIPDGETGSMSGTSMAAPFVAGVAGLMTSLDPGVTPAELKLGLMDSADPVDVLTGKLVSGGRLNALAALSQLSDEDHDGLPDSWEDSYGVDDPAGDADADGLTNLEEFYNGTDPNESDSDGDTLSDAWELRYGFTPISSSGALPRLELKGIVSACQNACDVAVDGDYAYVADGEYGLKILRVSELDSPAVIGSVSLSDLTVTRVAVTDEYAYLIGDSRLAVVNVSEPDSPVSLVQYDLSTEAYSLAVTADYLYVGTDDGVDIYATSDLQAAVESLVKVQSKSLLRKVEAIYLSGGYAFLGTSTDFAKYEVTGPVLDWCEGHAMNELDQVSAIAANDTHVFASGESAGIASYALNSSAWEANTFETNLITDISVKDNLLYTTRYSAGILVLDVTDPNETSQYASYSVDNASAVVCTEYAAWVAAEENGLYVFSSVEDQDSDGLPDPWEVDWFEGLTETSEGDFDEDGISNYGEYLADLNPLLSDQDADGLFDGDEVNVYLTDPREADTDGDGIADGDELNGTEGYITDPLNADSDSDGLDDNLEIDNGLDPTVDDSSADDDGDGLANADEILAGTDPLVSDSDSDGLPDGWEVDNELDPLTDDAVDDPDGDGLSNQEELSAGTDPQDVDSDDDELSDADEINLHLTDPLDSDSDSDGMPDGWEVEYGLAPNSDDASDYTDGDGLTNLEEYEFGSYPDDPDSDDDGFEDDEERGYETDPLRFADPVVVDDDASEDPREYDPRESDPAEDGTLLHPFDGIQEGIDVAEEGDTVLVMPGTYIGLGNIAVSTKGKAICVLAESGADNTEINTYGSSAGFLFESGESRETVLSGFKITTSLFECTDGDCNEQNGAICRSGSSPTITNCVIYDCALSGIYIEGLSDPLIQSTVISNCQDGVYALGNSTPEIEACSILDIATDSRFNDQTGYGVYVNGSEGATIDNCIISNTVGRGIFVTGDPLVTLQDSAIIENRGGIRLDDCGAIISRCYILSNHTYDYYSLNGTELLSSSNFYSWVTDTNLITDATGYEDVADENENGGGILLTDSSSVVLENCVVASNRTVAADMDYTVGDKLVPEYGLGGGLCIGDDSSVNAMNCTFADNEAMTRGGGISSYGAENDLDNMIIWGNVCSNAVVIEWVLDEDEEGNGFANEMNVSHTPSFDSIHCRTGVMQAWDSDIEYPSGNYPGGFNINANPNFNASTNILYYPSLGSPVIDAGTSYRAPSVDIVGHPRPLDGDNTGEIRIDMGAYEFIHPDADTDGDGVLDMDEIMVLGINALSTDTDGDLLPDGWEVQYGLDASSSDENVDSDGDGLSNIAESQQGSDPSTSDTDGDGYSDLSEFTTGTDPVDSMSVFVVEAMPLGVGYSISFETRAGTRYTVYYAENLEEGWAPLVTEDGTGECMTIDDNSEQDRFYRVKAILQ